MDNLNDHNDTLDFEENYTSAHIEITQFELDETIEENFGRQLGALSDDFNFDEENLFWNSSKSTSTYSQHH